MSLLRRCTFLLLLAVAFAAGQQWTLLHGLAHAAEKVAQKGDPKAPQPPCGDCALAAALTAAPGAAIPTVALEGTHTLATPHAGREALPAPRLVFRSRAPPVLS